MNEEQQRHAEVILLVDDDPNVAAMPRPLLSIDRESIRPSHSDRLDGAAVDLPRLNRDVNAKTY